MKYQIIYADPPWAFNNKRTGGSLNSGAGQKYDVMTVNDICNLPVKKITDDNCVLFMWWVGSMVDEAIQVARAWGFEIKTMTGFNWVKMTKENKLFFGMGFWTRQGLENCLIAIKGKPKRIDAGIRAVILAPAEEHSKKPDEVRKRIVKLMGDVPRIELFARQKTPGWDVWGNEVDSTVDIFEDVDQEKLFKEVTP
jgi:N6-adenosine-specific RNA methylase IME4